jgi:hypothetical protein
LFFLLFEIFKTILIIKTNANLAKYKYIKKVNVPSDGIDYPENDGVESPF